MRPKLLKSFIIVVLFWLLATTLHWSLQKPSVNLESLAQLKNLLPFLPFEVPGELGLVSTITAQKDVLYYWSLPMLLLSAISALIGAVVIWVFAFKKKKERTGRESGSGEFRGVTLTLGELPVPHVLPRDEVNLSADDNDMLSKVSEKELRLISDIIGTLSAHPNAYAGEGVSSSLVEHGLSLAEKSLNNKKHPGLSTIATLGHELAKITAYQKTTNGSWNSIKPHDREAARLLGTFESWNALPSPDKHAVMMAVKFKASPKLIPDVNGDVSVYKLARELLDVADVAVTETLVEQKQKTLEKTTELPDILFDAFLQALPSLSFQNRGLPKGVAAVAWKVGNRVYLLEIKLRETVMAKLPNDIRGALSPSSKDKYSKLQPFSSELLKALDSRGWLVKKINDIKLEAKEAVWNIKAGKLDFKGVIVVDIPPQYVSQLPSDDSMYEITVAGSLFSSNNANMGMSKNDLLGSVLKPTVPPQTED